MQIWLCEKAHYLLNVCISVFLLLLGLTSCKAVQPLQSRELQEKEVEKD